ncbi:MAG TPA: c-type cytochrome [Steroidobacteraceae bacterium]|nr:c-type cytochrome [Steroidobacteraceae bacterium]
MKTSRALLSVLAAIAFGLVASAAAAADAENGRKLAYACMGCHGIENYKNAYPKYSVPKLGGQSATYIVGALAEYDSGARWHPTMQGYAATLSEQDRADLAAWFASQSARKPGAKPVGKLPEAAAACTACHGTDGVGNIAENPTLAGQHADYLEQTLNDYRLGKRTNPIMGTFAKALTREEIRMLSRYYSQQPGLTTPQL